LDYNLKLGFEAIIIFDNSCPALPNQSFNHDVKLKSFKDHIAQKYGSRGVFIIDFPYLSMQYHHWNHLQFFTMTVGVDALRLKCKYIATIDIDEFIYLPENPHQKISEYLMQYHGKHVQMSSRVITNKNSNDLINNDVLKLAIYMSVNMYTKMLLYTPEIKKHEYIETPHNHKYSVAPPNSTIIHYHAWINRRHDYDPSMTKIDFLREFLYGE
jgi:hypothetical protein